MVRLRMAAVAIGLVLALATGRPAAAADFAAELQALLYAGKLPEAAALATQRLAAAPEDDQARFALGAAQFLLAVEHLGQGLYRYGLIAEHSDPTGLGGLPLLRLPVPLNRAPQPVTYEALSGVLAGFVADLEPAERTLSGVTHAEFSLVIELGKVRLDLDGDGTAGPDEALWMLFQHVANIAWLDAPAAAQLTVAFDAGDAAWLQAYCSLLMGVDEFVLGHDWHEAFDATFHNLFLRADTPLGRLDRAAMAEALAGGAQSEQAAALRQRAEMAGIADLVAFVHLIRWPVADPARLKSSLGHLEGMVRASRESWRRILAETDDDREWIPNPKQHGVLRTMPLSAEQIAAWNHLLDGLEAILAGRVLIPHWRFAEGLNVRRMFLEPTTFDLVLLIQGSAAIPYLEKGTLAEGQSWGALLDVFGGGFLDYAAWLN